MTHKPISLWRQNMAFKQKQFLILPSQHYVSSSQKKCNCSNVRVSKTILVFPKYDIFTKTSAHAKWFPIQWYVFSLPGWTAHVKYAQTNPNPVTNLHTQTNKKSTKHTQFNKTEKPKVSTCKHDSMFMSGSNSLRNTKPKGKPQHNFHHMSLFTGKFAGTSIGVPMDITRNTSASLLEEDWCSCFPLHTHPAEAGWE